MSGKLQKEIGKRDPFTSLEQEVVLNLLRTADRFMGKAEAGLKAAGLTPTQYNVLRILRGMSPLGIACQEIARRMITRDADLTRLLDRLESRGLVQRQRQTADRRVVHTTITPAGQTLLAELDPVMTELNQRALGHISKERLSSLLDLLEEARGNDEETKS
jgi:DNA-binding MarR family transcriptional regulator